MPGRDRTGPIGTGPMTGGGRGNCEPVRSTTGIGWASGRGRARKLGLGRRFASGHGRGCGWRHAGAGVGRGFGFGPGGVTRVGSSPFTSHAPYGNQEHRTGLREQLDAIESQLARIRDQLDRGDDS